jgi:flavin-dependent dehydrogenase
VRGRVRPHDRFFYFAYWRGIEQARTPRGPSIRIWLVEPTGAAEFPNEDGLTLLVASDHRGGLARARADKDTFYMQTLASLPDGPNLDDAERVSKVLGKLEMPNVMRPAAQPGIAFVGDAALATDPVFGVGISFAFQSAQWLVDETAGVLDRRQDLDQALRRYRRKFAWRLGPHHLQMADFSQRAEFRAIERLAFRRAASDQIFARALGQALTRERSMLSLIDPRIVARLVMPRQAPATGNSQPLRLATEMTA